LGLHHLALGLHPRRQEFQPGFFAIFIPRGLSGG
jgi:hypothetical protein